MEFYFEPTLHTQPRPGVGKVEFLSRRRQWKHRCTRARIYKNLIANTHVFALELVLVLVLGSGGAFEGCG